MFGDWKLSDVLFRQIIGGIGFSKDQYRLKIMSPVSISIVDKNGDLVAGMELPPLADSNPLDVTVEMWCGSNEKNNNGEVSLSWLPKIGRGALSWVDLRYAKQMQNPKQLLTDNAGTEQMSKPDPIIVDTEIIDLLTTNNERLRFAIARHRDHMGIIGNNGEILGAKLDMELWQALEAGE